ncbi:MAG: hypothetical protein CMH57_15435 [Myxococcales bacterium]|nr:hypothetical protein [Myxococcales bacterium]
MTRAIWMITLTWFGVVGGAPAARSEPIDCATAQECYAEGERYAKRSGRRPAQQAARYFERACDASWAPGCEALAALHLDGRLGQPDAQAVFTARLRACEASSARRCLSLALLYRDGVGVPVDPDRATLLVEAARRHLETLCRLEWGHACLELGLLLHRGDWLPPAPTQARLLLQRSCHTHRQPRGCYNLAQVHPEQESSSAGLLALACQWGYARACNPDAPPPTAPRRLPEPISCDLDQRGAPPRCASSGGDDSPPSWEEAAPRHARTLWRSCRDGDAGACLELSDLHQFGIGGPINAPIARSLRERAVQLLERGCAQGDLTGCRALAQVFTQGRYAEPDPTRVEVARRVTGRAQRAACSEGDVDACYAVAQRVLRDPEGDLQVAMGLLSQACDDDHPQACARLAGVFNQKRRPEFDRGKALRLYRKACYLGAAASCRTAIRLWLKAGAVEEAIDAQRFMRRRHQARCDEGNSGACLALHALLSEGPRPDRAAAEAALLVGARQLDRQCRLGQAASCARLAKLTRRPELPIPLDLQAREAELLERACRGGASMSQSTARACLTAGLMMELSARRPSLAQELYKRACVAGLAQACLWVEEEGWGARAAGLYRRSCAHQGEGCVELELLYLRGHAPRPDGAQEVSWAARLPELKRACRRRKESACVQLGVLYRDGLGVDRSPSASRRYFRRVERIRRRKCRKRGACEGLLELCRVGFEDACPSEGPLSER